MYFVNVKTGKTEIIDAGYQVNLGIPCEYDPLHEIRLAKIAKMDGLDDAFITTWTARGKKYMDLARVFKNRKIAEFNAYKYQHRTMYDLTNDSRVLV